MNGILLFMFKQSISISHDLSNVVIISYENNSSETPSTF